MENSDCKESSSNRNHNLDVIEDKTEINNNNYEMAEIGDIESIILKFN